MALENASEHHLPVPEIPKESESMELLRVWLIDGSPTYCITPYLWEDPSGWGILIADIIKHLGNAYERHGKSKEAVVARIKEVFDIEWTAPTSSADSVSSGDNKGDDA